MDNTPGGGAQTHGDRRHAHPSPLESRHRLATVALGDAHGHAVRRRGGEAKIGQREVGGHREEHEPEAVELHAPVRREDRDGDQLDYRHC